MDFRVKLREENTDASPILRNEHRLAPPHLDCIAGRHQHSLQSRLCLRDAVCGFCRCGGPDHEPTERHAPRWLGLARQSGHWIWRAALSLDGGFLAWGVGLGILAP